MQALEKVIREYVNRTNTLPSNLYEVRPLNPKIYGDGTIDFWGNAIIFSSQGTMIELKSLGEDHKEGGEREAKDVVLRFEAASQ